MASIKPSVPKGTRDFSPTEMAKRNFIFDTIKGVFRKYGYQQIETPSMENTDTLSGKYGDEGDKLIFKILESGEFMSNIKEDLNLKNEIQRLLESVIHAMSIKISEDSISNEGRKNETSLLTDKYFSSIEYLFQNKPPFYFNTVKKTFSKYLLSKGKIHKFRDHKTRLNYYLSIGDLYRKAEEAKKGLKSVISRNTTADEIFLTEIYSSKYSQNFITKKALRYDLTVPFARYVVQHQNDIAFPFKRFQVQPVWRADRPQKGRYREFYQCDADVVGSDSLLNEAEFVMIYDEALGKLGLKDFTIKINNRKILSGIAETINKTDNIIDLTVAIDKLDKIGFEGVVKELMERGFTEADIEKIKPVILLQGTNKEKLESLRLALTKSDIGLKGCDEIEEVLNYVAISKLQTAKLELDITLARGLNYYTGAIFEVKTNEVAMGSIGGGGRYDDLTGMFGLKGLTGVGISFGADRIYDVMEELDLFPTTTSQSTQLLICCFDKEGETFALPILRELRRQDIYVELYPAGAKLKKQLDYANDKNIPYAIIIGSEEIESGMLTLKDMGSGVQSKRTIEQIFSSFNPNR